MKYLCINDIFSKKSRYIKYYPKFGEIYTLEFKRKELNGRIGLILKELNNPYFFSWHWGEMVLPSFDESRFVPWEEKEIITQKIEVING